MATFGNSFIDTTALTDRKNLSQLLEDIEDLSRVAQLVTGGLYYAMTAEGLEDFQGARDLALLQSLLYPLEHAVRHARDLERAQQPVPADPVGSGFRRPLEGLDGGRA